MSATTRNKITALAGDLNIKGKDILKLFADDQTKQKATALSDAEVDYVIYTLAQNANITDIDSYIEGKIAIEPMDTPEKIYRRTAAEREKLRQQEKILAEEKKKAEAKAAAQAVAARQGADIARRVQEKANGIITEKERQLAEQKNRAREESRQRMEAQKKAVEAKKKDKKPAQRQNFTTIQVQTAGISDASGIKDLRRVDTRGGDANVNLSKYDDKILAYGVDSHDGGLQKFRKNRNNFNRRHDKRRVKKNSEPIKKQIREIVKLPEELIVSDLAKELMVTTGEVMKKLMMLGFPVSVNQYIDFDTAAIVADEFGSKAERLVEVTIEEKLIDETADNEEDLVERNPVVVVMGHVDHGKTSLLDAIRNSNVTSGEAGGITQHIGAYTVKINDKDITFLDTPGHAAFTAMRARGAQATDIAVIVVAADDGIMPQTIEAINHAKEAGVAIIVAINKMDKPTAKPENVMQELTKYDLVPEEWGGDIICVPVSAVTKAGIDNLLESILLVSEMADLKANPNRLAKGIVIEAKLDKGRGPVATVLVQNGTLKTGDTVIAGTTVGHIRAMTDDKGKQVKSALPGVPVEILGLSAVPGAGDILNAVENERMARELAEQRNSEQKEEGFRAANSAVSLDNLFTQMKEGAKELAIIVKADVQGSTEAVKSSLEKLSNDEVKVRVIHSGVGGINESDVMLASASNAIIIGFNVRPDKTATESAHEKSIDIRTYRIIYECIEEVEAAMKGMLSPKFHEVVLGQAEVRQTIRVPNVGVIAGSYVNDGKIVRNASIRVLRDNVVIFEDKLASLRRFKDDAKEVAQGYECGIGLEKFNDIKEGDILEAFVMEEITD